MNAEARIFRENFDFQDAIARTRDIGYCVINDALDDSIRHNLNNEIESLPLELGDHVNKPINEGKSNQVVQQHERFYSEYGDPRTTVANIVIAGLAKLVSSMEQFPELQGWLPNEIGYQRYRHGNDFIGAHRDRASDRQLSVTFTVSGSTVIKMFDPVGDYLDYTKLLQTDEFVASAGSVMLLRAQGLGSGEQVIHQVLPPEDSRTILNLRSRPTILEPPSKIQ